MNAIINEIYETGHTAAPDGSRHAVIPISVKRAEGEALYQLVRRLQPRATIEIGMAWGLSTLFLCQGHRDNHHPNTMLGHHTAIDPFQTECYHRAALHALTRAGLSDLVTFFEESSHTVLPRMVAEKQTADLIFIDGSHLFDHAFADFFYADQLLPVGGILVFDDLWMPAVRKVLNFALRNRHYQIAEELLPAPQPWLATRYQDFRYRLRKRLRGRTNAGAPPESAFHRYRNINWTILRKTAPDDRKWDHFSAF